MRYAYTLVPLLRAAVLCACTGENFEEYTGQTARADHRPWTAGRAGHVAPQGPDGEPVRRPGAG